MKVLTVRDNQHQQSFQMGKLKLGHTIIPGEKLGEVDIYSKMTSRRKIVFIVALLQRSGQVLRKFGRYTFNEAINIHAQLSEAKRLTQEAPEGRVIDFFKINHRKALLPKVQIKKLGTIDPIIRKSPHAIFTRKIGPIIVNTVGEGSAQSYSVAIQQKKNLGEAILWTCVEKDQSMAMAIAEAISFAAKRATPKYPSQEAFINPEVIAKGVRARHQLSIVQATELQSAVG